MNLNSAHPACCCRCCYFPRVRAAVRMSKTSTTCQTSMFSILYMIHLCRSGLLLCLHDDVRDAYKIRFHTTWASKCKGRSTTGSACFAAGPTRLSGRDAVVQSTWPNYFPPEVLPVFLLSLRAFPGSPSTTTAITPLHLTVNTHKPLTRTQPASAG